MSKQFNANFNISGVNDLGSGNWEIMGEVIDYSFDAWSVYDVQAGDCVVDESPFYGTYNRWKVTSIAAIGISSFGGATANSIRLVAIWDDVGDMDTNGPAGGIALIARPSENRRIVWNGSITQQGISEALQNRINSINNFVAIDPFLYKSVKNGTLTTFPAYSVLAWEDDGTVSLATATSHSLSDIAGICVKSIEPNAFGTVIKMGYIPDALIGYSASPGNTVYLSETPGQMTLTCPTSLTDTIIKIGRAEPPSGIATSTANDLHMEMEVMAEP